MSITITAYSVPGNSKHTVKLDKTGNHAGAATVDGSTYNLSNVSATADGQSLSCTVFFFSVTATLHPAPPPTNPPQNYIVNIGIPFGSLTYQISAADEKTLADFLKKNFA